MHTNDLRKFINMDIIKRVKENRHLVSDISIGEDSGCGYKNDIFVSFYCTEEHDDKDCLCSDVLNQEALKDIDIDLALAEKIAIFVAGLIDSDLNFIGNDLSINKG